MILRLLFLLSFSFPIYATVFQMQSIDQQIKEADSIMMGHFLKQESVQLDDGSPAIQMIFKVDREYGLRSDEFGMDEVIVHYPGGQMGEETVRVDGVPQFVAGEQVVLMISSRDNRYWGMNLGFGTFKVVNYGHEKMLVNTLFPHDTRVGQVKMEDFLKKVRFIKHSSLKVVQNKDYPIDSVKSRAPASIREEKMRSIASHTDQVDNEQEGSRVSPLWLVVFLAILGGLFRLMRHKEAK